MANRYWVGGAGTWNTSSTANWATSSGGSSGASAPTSADDVFIDTSSGTGTITCTAAVCNNITVTATQAIILGAASSTLSVFGDLTFPSGGSFSVTAGSTITFAATTTGKTITTNGKSVSNIIFNGVGGGWTLGSAFTFCNAITFTNGTFDTSSTNNYSVTSIIYNLGAGTKTINFNASTITGSGNQVINFLTNATGLTFNAGTSTINISGATPTVQGNGNTFYNVSFTNTGVTAVMTGANTFNNLTFTSRTADGINTYNIDSNQTVNGTLTLGAGNTAVRRIFLFSSAIGTQRTITATTVATLSDVDFRDISFSASQSGTRLGNCGGNNNITFPSAKTVYWNLAGSVNWSAVGWATSSGGTPAVNNFPLAQDTAVIDNTSAGSGITINLAWNIGTFDASLRTSALTITLSSVFNCYLNWITGTGITYSGTFLFNFAGRTTQQLTSAGVSFTNGITINTAPSGSVQLQDAFTTTAINSGVILTQGALDLNDKTLSCFLFSSNNSNTRSIAFGTLGQINLTGNATTLWQCPTLTNFSFTGTSKVNLTANATTGTRGVQHGQTAGGSESLAFNFNVTAGSDTVTIYSYIRNLDYTGFSGIMANDNVATKAIYGNLTLSSTMTAQTGTAGLRFSSTTQTQTITTNGVTLDFPITLNGTQTYQLGSALTMGSTRTITFTTGTFNADIYNVTTGVFASSNSNTRTLTMGSGTWTLTGTGTVWSFATITNLTLNSNTSQINTTSTSTKTFAGGGQTYYNLSNTGSGTLTITGSNTYNNLTALGGCPLTITSGTTQSANTFTFQGASSVTIAPSSTTNYTLTKLGGGIVDMQNVSISRCTANPSTGTWYAGASTDGGNNTGIRFVSAPKFMAVF